jgi:bifunctional UDP-N-acetylglucosamine pyrophosphorylase/glucosamine-1-phosphate N-acetyltransferase
MLTDTQAILLAAGKATRFNTGNTKLTEKVCGQELILYPLAVLKELNIPTTLVLGFQGKTIQKVVEKKHTGLVSTIEQTVLGGTGLAIQATKPVWKSEDILIMKADLTLISADIIEALYKKHRETQATISFVTAHSGDPTGFSYSRVIKKEDSYLVRKAQELSFEELQDYCCVSGGVYLVKRSFLEHASDLLEKNTATGEYHVSQLVNIAQAEDEKIETLRVPFDCVRGINNQQELWAVEQIKRSELIKYWMDRGVRFSAAQSVHMDLNVEIGTGSFIGCSVHLLAGTRIGTHCTVNAFSIVENSTLGDHTTVHSHSVVRDSHIGSHSHVGPFAHVRNKSTVGDNTTIGNFVETSRTTIGNNSKAKHLSYLGDAHVGDKVNIGAGTITCNYDGRQKHKTEIKDSVFIGTNNSLVAPLTIEAHSFTAAGSTITDNVPEGALAIGRARQVTKEGYAAKLKQESDQARLDEKKIVSFIGAYKTDNGGPQALD